MHKAEREFLKGFGSDLVKVDGGDTVAVGGVTVSFIHTPGHTPGSQCFLVDGRLVSGDTLFIRSCGRTDLPGSDPAEMYYSLTQRLGALPDITVVFPGHNYGGSTTTIGDEKRANPMMRFSSMSDFLRAMGGASATTSAHTARRRPRRPASTYERGQPRWQPSGPPRSRDRSRRRAAVPCTHGSWHTRAGPGDAGLSRLRSRWRRRPRRAPGPVM